MPPRLPKEIAEQPGSSLGKGWEDKRMAEGGQGRRTWHASGWNWDGALEKVLGNLTRY